MKVDGYSAENNEVFEHLGCSFGMVVSVYPNDTSHYSTVHLQQGVLQHVSETRFCMYYPLEVVVVWEITSLLRPLNGRRTLVGRITMLFMPVMGAKFFWLGKLM